MNTSDEIRCPKCGSNQLTANKKGFSGKKAVAGVILTGGIGLLAGTIGSNKIIITCLNCGNQFKPGEKKSQSTPKIIWDQSTKQHIQNPNYALQKKSSLTTSIVILSIFVFLVWMIFKGCDTSDKGNQTIDLNSAPIQSATKLTAANSDIPKPSVRYEIATLKEDNTGASYLLYVYVKNAKGIDNLNAYLVKKYQNPGIKGFQIYYFNNKTIAEDYYDRLFDPNETDGEIDRLTKHIVARYEYNSTDGGKLEFGKEARE